MIHRNDTTWDVLEPSTRRRLLQLLGGAAVGSGVLALGHEQGAAGRKKKCHSKCNSEEKCIGRKCVPIRRP
jgi:hypothetical protein